MGGKGVCLLVGEHVQIKAFGGGRSFWAFLFFFLLGEEREGNAGMRTAPLCLFERMLTSCFV